MQAAEHAGAAADPGDGQQGKEKEKMWEEEARNCLKARPTKNLLWTWLSTNVGGWEGKAGWTRAELMHQLWWVARFRVGAGIRGVPSSGC